MLLLLLTGTLRVLIWLVGLRWAVQRRRILGTAAFGTLACLASLNTCRTVGWVAPGTLLDHIAVGVATPIAVLVVAAFIAAPVDDCNARRWHP